jgi:transposase
MISQGPAPFHVLAPGWAGPNLLAMGAVEKFGQHQPLNRQANEDKAVFAALVIMSSLVCVPAFVSGRRHHHRSRR